MGDRANIKIKACADEAPIYLYAHWGGDSMPLVVQEGLQYKGRWSDPAYLTRIIFCHLISAGDLHTDTGFGISTRVQDNDGYPIVEVDCETRKVRFIRHDWKTGQEGDALREWSFEDYLAEMPESLQELFNGRGGK